MFSYWWVILVAGAITFGAGAIMWMNAAAAMVRVVMPSAAWIKKESKFSSWGARLMAIGAILAVIGVMIAVRH
jgi:hypothetical protein